MFSFIQRVNMYMLCFNFFLGLISVFSFISNSLSYITNHTPKQTESTAHMLVCRELLTRYSNLVLFEEMVPGRFLMREWQVTLTSHGKTNYCSSILHFTLNSRVIVLSFGAYKVNGLISQNFKLDNLQTQKKFSRLNKNTFFHLYISAAYNNKCNANYRSLNRFI